MTLGWHVKFGNLKENIENLRLLYSSCYILVGVSDAHLIQSHHQLFNEVLMVCWVLFTWEVFAVRRGVNLIFEVLNFVDKPSLVFLNNVELLLKPWLDHTLENSRDLNNNFGVKFKRLSLSWRLDELYGGSSNLCSFICQNLLSIAQCTQTLLNQSDNAPLIIAVLDKIVIYHRSLRRFHISFF